MQVIILAGGLGTRMSEETDFIPKPMSKIGKKPILWHLLKYYNHFGFKDFVICSGYIRELGYKRRETVRSPHAMRPSDKY